MNRRPFLMPALTAVLLIAATAHSANAQQPSRFIPARPTFSNYLLYRQFNATGIPNYYAFIQPTRQFEDFRVRNRATQRRPTQSLTVEQEVARVLEAQLTERLTTGVGQASVPARFNDTSHFFTVPRIPSR